MTIRAQTEIKVTEFWQDNLQKLEEISNELELALNRLEDEYLRLYPLFDDFEKTAAALSTIQSSFNNMEGRGYILKLNAVIAAYRKIYITEGIDFSTLRFLLTKINEMRNKSFDAFPWLYHYTKETQKEKKEPVIKAEPEKSPFKWVSFFANSSWFIIPFKSLEISNRCDNYKIGELEHFTASLNGIEYEGRYIFSKFADKTKIPEYFLIVDKHRLFGADKSGRRIYAYSDFIKKQIQPFEGKINNTFFAGRVRLFGINHLYINET